MTDLVFIICRDTYTNISKEREKTMTSNLSHYVELAMKVKRRPVPDSIPPLF